MSAKESFLKVYDQEHATTMRVLKAYPEDQLDLKPSEKSNSARQIAYTFVLERMLGTKILNDEFKNVPPSGSTPPKPPESWSDLLDALEKVHQSFRDLIASTSEEDFMGTVHFMVGPKKLGEMSRSDAAWFLLHDQIHHRGQLSVYLRMAGGKVPSIYGPTADEPWT
jgi:uncharacterized damage-inducible protein DinB